MDRGEGRRLTRRKSRSKFDEAKLQRFGQQAGSLAFVRCISIVKQFNRFIYILKKFNRFNWQEMDFHVSFGVLAQVLVSS